MSGLTPKQEKFCQKYVQTACGSEAYRQSYDAGEMANETIASEASRLLHSPHISARIERLQELARKRNEVTVDRVVAEYSKLAFLDIRRAFNEDGTLKPIHEIDDDTAAALAGIEVEALYEGRGGDRELVGRLHKIKLSDKRAALDSLAKHLGMFVERVEHTGKDGKPIEISDAKAALLRGLVPDAPASGTDQEG